MQTAASYVWSFTGAPLRVALDLPVVSALRTAIEAHAQAEVGGLLLGNSSGGVTHITSFELVPCEHRRGEAYDLSPLDRSRFSRLVSSHTKKNGRGATVVGYFRSHHRLGLYLDEHDFRTIQEFFPNADQVVLLIRPEQAGPPAAGFFFWDEGEMHRRESFQPFPFDEQDLANGDYPVEAAVIPAIAEKHVGGRFSAVSTRLAPEAPQTKKPSRLVASPVWLRDPGTWWKTAALVAGIPLGLAFGHYLTHKHATVPASFTPYTAVNSAPVAVQNVDARSTQAASQEPPAAAAVAPPDLTLPVKPSPWATTPAYGTPAARPRLNAGAWRTRQDPLETPLRTYGQARRPLEPAQFAHSGASAASPSSFGSIVPATVQQAAPVERQPAPVPNGPPAEEAKRVVAENHEPLNVPPFEPEHPVHRAFRPETRPAISLEPLTDGEHLVTKNVRRLGRLVTLGVLGSDAFRPARPLREFAPAVPDSVSRQLKRPVPIAVRITIDRDGRVRGTELLTHAADPELALLAVDAARKWEFEAARRNDEPVSSSVVAHFRFRPPAQ